MEKDNNIRPLEESIIAKYSAVLSLTEIGIGAFMHSFKIPLTGQLLSLNQIFILTKAQLETHNKKSAVYISTTSALLKSLAPAGKKLTPMLAISMQGQLYYLGLKIAGNNLIGQIIGATLSSLWAYMQPFAIYFILFGEDLFYMYDYFFEKVSRVIDLDPQLLWWALSGFISIKVVLAVTAVFVARKIPTHQFKKYAKYFSEIKQTKRKKTKVKNPFLMAIKDLLNPLLLFSFILSATFFYYAKHAQSSFIWSFLRPITLAYLIFLFIRIFPVEKWSERLAEGPYKRVLNSTIKLIKKKVDL